VHRAGARTSSRLIAPLSDSIRSCTIDSFCGRTEQMHELVAGAAASFRRLGGRTGARACRGEDPVDAGDLVLEHPDVAQQLLRPVVEAICLRMRCNATLLTAVPRASQQTRTLVKDQGSC
jgi:hypothetical protein